MDLLLLQERETRVQGKAWLRDRVTTLAMQQSGGNPARRLQALYRRQRALLEDPVLPLGQRQTWDAKQEQERLLALQRQEQLVAEQDRQLGFAPFPVTYRLPALFEDLARLAQAQPAAAGEVLSLPPAVLGCCRSNCRLLRPPRWPLNSDKPSKRWGSVMRRSPRAQSCSVAMCSDWLGVNGCRLRSAPIWPQRS